MPSSSPHWQGKNRPLDEEELQFFDTIAEAEALKRRQEEEEEAAELDSFRRLRQEQEGAGRPKSPRVLIGPVGPPEAADGAAPQQQPAPRPPHKRAVAAMLKPVIRRVQQKQEYGPASAAPDPKYDVGLEGLLGSYASSSDDDAQ